MCPVWILSPAGKLRDNISGLSWPLNNFPVSNSFFGAIRPLTGCRRAARPKQAATPSCYSRHFQAHFLHYIKDKLIALIVTRLEFVFSDFHGPLLVSCISFCGLGNR